MQYPTINVDFMVRKEYADILKNNPHVQNLWFFHEDAQSISGLKDQQYDLIIDLQNNFRSRRVSHLFNCPVVRFNKRSIDKFLLVKFKINRLRNAQPIPERYASNLPGLLIDQKGLDLFLPDKLKPSINLSGKSIGFCPGSRHFTKMWPEEYFLSLARLLAEKGYNIIFFGGKSDVEICAGLSAQIPSSINLSNEDNLFQTACDMKLCDLIVCNDSGMMHTACALKIPVAVFFGSTVKEFGFTPYKNKNLIFENNSLSCRPCSHIGRSKCPLGHFNCMRALRPEDVFISLQQTFDI